MTCRVAPIALILVLLSACGGNSPAIDEDASRALQLQVQAIRDSAHAFDPAGVERGLADVRASVAQSKEAGKLSDDHAAEILAAAADVEALIEEVPTTTTTTTTLPEVDEDDDDGKRGPGSGDRRGRGGDD